MTTPARSILVVIVNYRSGPLTVASLHALAAEFASLPQLRVAVVDNDSRDDSADVIQAGLDMAPWRDRVSLIRAPRNGGYAYGNNLAIRPALTGNDPPDYIHLLNPDTEIRPGAIQTLVNYLETHPAVGIGGSSFEEADGSPWPNAFRFPSLLSELDAGLRLGIVNRLLRHHVVLMIMGDEPAAADWLPGASLMIRRQVFDDIGLMDEGYFLYFEETDFCHRAAQAGWMCWYVPASRVMHILGQSTGVTDPSQRQRRLPRYWFDSRRRYFLKHHGLAYTALTDLVWMGSFMLWRLRRRLQAKPDNDPAHLLGDFCRNSVWCQGGRWDRKSATSDPA